MTQETTSSLHGIHTYDDCRRMMDEGLDFGVKNGDN